jgi:hypothetical protein
MKRAVRRAAEVLAAFAACTCQAASSSPQGQGGEQGNLFHEPFFPLSAQRQPCPEPRGPWWTAEEARADAHWRSQSGVSCHLAGKCRKVNSYLYDDEIAQRVRQVFERDDRLHDSTVWVHVQRRIVTVMGCVKDEAQRELWRAAMQGIDDVNAVVDQTALQGQPAPYVLSVQHE